MTIVVVLLVVLLGVGTWVGRRRVPFARRVVRVLAALSLFVALAACSVNSECGLFGGSSGTSIDFEGARYGGMSAQDLSFDEDDLELMGTAEEMNLDVSSRDVYALDGVDPEEFVVMRTAEDHQEDFILYYREPLRYTAGFCQYFIEPPPEC